MKEADDNLGRLVDDISIIFKDEPLNDVMNALMTLISHLVFINYKNSITRKESINRIYKCLSNNVSHIEKHGSYVEEGEERAVRKYDDEI